MAEQIKFGDRLFLRGEKVLFDNGTLDAVIESRNGTLVIKGNLIVDGTTTSVNTINTEISDPFILLNSEHSGAPTENVGIEVERGTEGTAKFGWDETNDRWSTFGGTSFYSPHFVADTIVANTSVTGPLISDDVNITGGNIDGTVIGTTTPVQGYFSTIHGDGTNITNVLTNYTTDDLAEGLTNLYYTDFRVDQRLNELFDAGYGISAGDPDNPGFSVSFDAINIGNGSKVLDESNTDQAAFRTLVPGPNLDLTVAESGDEVVIDTAVKINNLEFNSFTGNGANSVFTLPYTVSQDWQVLVYIDGVVQEPTTSYSVTSNTLTLSSPLANGSVMNIIKMASNTVASTVTDATTLNSQLGSYYLDYNNFVNTPTDHATETYVDTAISDLVGGASSAFDTLKEIQDAMATDTELSNAINSLVIPSDVSDLTDNTNLLDHIDLSSVDQDIIPSQDATYDLGTATQQWNVIYGHTVEATYADLAERYAADVPYAPGTVLVLGGEAEVTTTTLPADSRVIGVVSTDPGLKLNSQAGSSETHPYIALKGRIPCRVVGKVEKGDLLVTADKAGYAKSSLGVPMTGTVIGKAMESKPGTGEGVIEIFVSMM